MSAADAFEAAPREQARATRRRRIRNSNSQQGIRSAHMSPRRLRRTFCDARQLHRVSQTPAVLRLIGRGLTRSGADGVRSLPAIPDLDPRGIHHHPILRRQAMNMDTASHPGRTGTADLVPSRYALRVGEIDVLVISDGVLPLPASTLATNAKPAELAAWLDEMRQPPDVFKWPLNVIVVRSGGRTVLVDAGIGAELPKDFPQSAGLLAGRLTAAGIDP